MKKSIPFIGASLFVLAGCLPPDGTPERPYNTNIIYLPDSSGGSIAMDAALANGDCDIRTDALSTGAGAPTQNGGIHYRMFDHMVMSPKVANLYQQVWGREGEVSHCAQVPNVADRAILEAELNDILSTFGPPVRGIVRVQTH
jgi:hypothetical protein